MRKLIPLPLFLFVSAFLMPLTVVAQESIVIDNMQVEFWPEFDRQEMLVIYRIQLSADLNYPVALSLPMPAGIEDANAVAVPGEAGNLVIAPYELDEQGDWTYVLVTVDSPIVQFEYYDPDLEINGDQREYQYLWEGLYSVSSFSIQVQEPSSTSTIEFTPSLNAPVQGPDTLQYHNGSFGAVEAGEELTLDIAYTKTSSILTVEFLNPTGSDPGVSVVANSFDWGRWVGWGLGILGVGILAYAGYSWLKPKPHKDTFRQGRRSAAKKASKDAIDVFCHNCGTQAHAGDKFCRECGTALRL